MQIAPPFGYREIAPFLKTQKVRLLAPGEVPEFARRGNAIPISHTNSQFAAREYPIVFTSGDEGKSFAPVRRARDRGRRKSVRRKRRLGARRLRPGLCAPLPVLHGEGDAQPGGAEGPA